MEERVESKDNLGRILTFKRKRRPFSISAWFAKLAHVISRDRLTIRPTGFLLVLINEDDVEVYRYGSTALIHDAVLAAKDYEHHRQSPEWSETPQEMRESRKRRVAQHEADTAAYEAAHPHVCAICGSRRFATKTGLAQHQRSCAKTHARWSSS